MKVLLTAVNAKYIHSNLAVYDLRAYAEAYGTGGKITNTVHCINTLRIVNAY